MTAECKNCTIKRAVARYHIDVEKSREAQRASYGRTKEWRLVQIKKYHSENSQKVKLKRQEWINGNPKKLIEYRVNREATKRHEISEKEWNDCKNYFNDECACCGLSSSEQHELYGKQFSRDHYINDGANDLSNCIPLCTSCNSRKWKYSFNEWYTEENIKYDELRLSKIKKWITEDYKLYKR